MAYKLIITEYADKLLDQLIYHLLFRLKNELAAQHLLSGIENVYGRLEENPLQFPLSSNTYLASKDCHEAIVPQMNLSLFSM